MPFSLDEFAGVATEKKKDFSFDEFAATAQTKTDKPFSLDEFADVPKSLWEKAKDVAKDSVKMAFKANPLTEPLIGIAETGVAMLPSMAMEGAVGLAGMSPQFVVSKMALDKLQGKDISPLQASSDIIEKGHEITAPVQEFLQPRTETGKALTKGVSYPFELAHEMGENAQDYWEAKGHYKTGFVNKMLLEAAPFLIPYAPKILKEAKIRGTSPIKIAEEIKQNPDLIKTIETTPKEEPKIIQEKDYINDVTLGELQNIVAKGGDATAHVYEGLKEGKITQEQAITVRSKALSGALEKAKTPEEKNRIWENVKVEADNMQDVIENYKPSTDIFLKQVEAKKTVANPVVEGMEPSQQGIELQKPIDYEPFIKGGATGELPKYAEGSAINLEKLDTTNDIKQFLNQLTKDNEQRIGKKTVTWKETEEAAKALGWNMKDVIKQRKGKAFTAAEIEAMRQINVSALTELHNKIKSIPADKTMVTPEMQLDVINSVSNYGELLKTLSSASSEAGRALNIHKKMMANNPGFAMQSNINKVIKSVLEQSNLEKVSKQLIEDLQKVDFNDPVAVNKIIQKYHKASIGDMIYEGWMNFLLSAPKTHAVNITSNALTLLSNPILETPTAALLETFKKNKQVYWGEVKAETIGTWQGMKEGVRAMVKAFETGMPSDMWSKAELPHLNAIPGKAGELIRIPTRALTAADEFFKSVVYRMELNRQAYSSAAKEGLKGKARIEKMVELLEKPTTEMLGKAHNEALYRTFNKPLGIAGNTLMKFRDSIPYNLGRYIVPFLRTPANIAKFALERTPLNFAKIAKDYKQGKITPDQLSFELAKPIVGSLLGAATVMLVKEGLITGGGTKDKNKRDTLYRTGWKPYSIKIGDEYYGYNRLEPLGSVLGLAADFGEMQFSKEDQKLDNLAGQISLSFGKNITSKTFMKGVSGVLDAISDPERYGDSFVNQYSGTLIPSIVASVANTNDPLLRQKNNPLEAIKSRIPGVSDMLLPKRDLWGNPIEKTESPTNRLLSPVPVSTIKADKVDKEMLRLGLNMGMPSKKIMGIELSPEEYDNYVTLAGQTAKKKLDLKVNSPSWNYKTDEAKARLIKGKIEAERKVASIKVLRTKDKEEVKAKIKENRKLVKGTE